MRTIRTKKNLPLLIAALVLASCATSQPPEPTPAPKAERIQATDSIFLIGDAGGRERGDQVLDALHDEVSAASANLGSGHVAVIFLGDNIYNDGLPPENDREFRQALARLQAQVQSANVNSGVSVYFVPGNHDWHNKGREGLERIRRQTEQLARFGTNVQMLPGNGCPGPVVRTAGDRLQIVFLDTQWWLHSPAFARPTAEDCNPNPVTEEGVTAAIRNVLSNADGRLSIVVAHHPLISGGPHGRDPRSRANEQDQNNDKNEHMRKEIIGALQASPPLAWASGHEHTLEVLQGGGASFLLVSGAGNFDRTDPTIPDPRRGNWLFPSSESDPPGGFMRLDIPAEGTPSVSVITVDRNRTRRTVFSRALGSP